MDPIAYILEIVGRRGSEQYGDEPVSQREHALQSAALAEAAGSDSSLIVAALLHDIGHLVDGKAEGAAARGVDRHHEDIGAGWLSRYFGAAVVEPVRLHVPAKRWLCWAEKGYWSDLSPASQRSLELQGGVFDDAGAAAFEAMPHARGAIELRRWDDLAKIQDLRTPPLAHYVPMIEACIIERGTVTA